MKRAYSVVAINLTLIEELLALPARQVWSEYDADADVLYLSVRKPQQANDSINDSIMEDDGNVYHYRDGDLVGVTVMHASEKVGRGKIAR